MQCFISKNWNITTNQIFCSDFTMRHNLNWNLFNVSEIITRYLKRVRIWIKICIQRITFRITLHHENDKFCVFCVCSKNRIIIQQIYDASNFEKHFYNVSVFEIMFLHCLRPGVRKLTRIRFSAKKTLQGVKIWFKSFGTFQILN